jgi:hypothetical protein
VTTPSSGGSIGAADYADGWGGSGIDGIGGWGGGGSIFSGGDISDISDLPHFASFGDRNPAVPGAAIAPSPRRPPVTDVDYDDLGLVGSGIVFTTDY